VFAFLPHLHGVLVDSPEPCCGGCAGRGARQFDHGHKFCVWTSPGFYVALCCSLLCCSLKPIGAVHTAHTCVSEAWQMVPQIVILGLLSRMS